MPGEFEFDMSSAVGEISSGLGFDTDTDEVNDANDVDLSVDPSPSPANPGSGAGDIPGQSPAGSSPDGDPAADDSGNPPAGSDAAIDPLAIAPKTWRKEAADTWATLPAQVRQEILKREDDIFKGIEGYKSEAAYGKSFRTVLDPFLPALRQHGLDPVAQVGHLMTAHHTLALGTPEQKNTLFRQIAADYKIDLTTLTPADEPSFIDPAVKALQTEVQQLHSKLSAGEQSRLAQAREQQTKAIEAFAADPANPHFEDVANDMVTLIEKGVCSTLQEAYEKAIWTNPAVRAKELTRQQAEASAKAREAAEKKVADARKLTAANVRTKAKSGSATTPLGSMDDTLAETLAVINSRA